MDNEKKLNTDIDYENSCKISYDRKISSITEVIKDKYIFIYISEISVFNRIKIGFISSLSQPKLLTRTFSNKETIYDLNFLSQESSIYNIFPVYKKNIKDRKCNLKEGSFSFIHHKNKILFVENKNNFIIDFIDLDFILNVDLINGVVVFDYLNYVNLMISNLNQEDLVFLYRVLKYKKF